MRKKISAFIFSIFFIIGGIKFGYSQSSFHDTKGELEVSSGGQALYKVPIALPPTIQNFAPKIDLQYQSGTLSGIAGVGWSIEGVSTISRIASRRDIDGFKDGVDFDGNDKLSLDGQRLILVSGSYWGDGSFYETELKSNLKVKQIGSKNSASFIVYYPDGSLSWYGKYGSRTARDEFKYFLVMRKDANGNRIRFEYDKKYGEELYLSQIKFGNYGFVLDESDSFISIPKEGDDVVSFPIVDGGRTPTPQYIVKSGNRIIFSYKEVDRYEKGYAGGKQIEKKALLLSIEVYSEDELFKKYSLTHDFDFDSGFQRVIQIKEFNGDGEGANPIVFEYEKTLNQVTEETWNYYSDFNFEDITLTGDFDGDNRMDFLANSVVHKEIFGVTEAIKTPINYTVYKSNSFVATVLDSNNKLKNFNSIVKVESEIDGVRFKIYDAKGVQQFDYDKKFVFDNLGLHFPYCPCPRKLCKATEFAKMRNGYLQGDFNGDGITDVIILTYMEEIQDVPFNIFNFGIIGGIDPCNQIHSTTPEFYLGDNPKVYIADLNRNRETTNGTRGFTDFSSKDDSKLKGNARFIGDFNGDGKSDILVIDKERYRVVSFNQNEQGIYTEIEILGEGTIPGYNFKRQILLGDFNGDGKTDFIVPDSDGGTKKELWNVYLANPKPTGGEFFVKSKETITEYWPNSQGYFDTQVHLNSYYAMDVDGDGKTDLVRIWINRYKPKWTINDHDTQWKVSVFKNKAGNKYNQTGRMFVKDYESLSNHDSDNNWIPIPIATPYKHNGVEKDLIVLQLQNNKATYLDFKKDYTLDSYLKKVKMNGGEIQYEINYAELNDAPKGSSVFYYNDNKAVHPNVNLKESKDIRLVRQLKKKVNDNEMFQDFKYHNFTVNMDIGGLGFEKLARSSWYKTESEKKKWHVSVFDLSKRSVEIKNYTFLNTSYLKSDLPYNNSYVVDYKQSDYNVSEVNKVIKIELAKEWVYNNLTKVKSEISYQYAGPYNLIDTKITKNFLNTLEQGKTTEKITYKNVDEGGKYIIGKPQKIVTTNSAYGGTYITQEEYEYDSKGNITKEKNRPTASTYTLVTSNKFDSYGNTIEKTLSTEGSDTGMTERKTLLKYDSTSRFAIEETDTEGLVSKRTYDKRYGQLLTSEDPFGRKSKFEYDKWGKLTKEIDYLGNAKTYTYSFDSSTGNYIASVSGADGHFSTKTTDVLGRQVSEMVNTVDGKNLKTSVTYDIYGRKTGDYGPTVVGQPTIWMKYSYDDYDRLKTIDYSTTKKVNYTYEGVKVSSNDGLKTETTTVNANGHQIEATDAGGKIVYAYNAQGVVKSSTFDGTSVVMEYDAWGRKIKLTDPSAGVYTYKYNAFGALTEENTPKGKTTFQYDDVGKLLNKKVVGENTHHNITYVYDNTTKLLKSSTATINGSVTEYTNTYNNLLQLTNSVEKTPKVTYSKTFTYDSFGRVSTEAVKTTAFGKVFENKIKNEYKNGKHWKVIDAATNKMLTEKALTDNIGNLGLVNLGNGLEQSFGYDLYSSLPSSLKVRKSLNIYSILDISTNFDRKRGNLLNRTSNLFGVTETFRYDDMDRLIEFTNGTRQQETQEYDNKGRIVKNTLGNYQYNGAKKYQLNTISLTGNAKPYYQERSLLEVAYNTFKSPVSIHEKNKEDLYFDYNSSGNRSVMYYGTITSEKEQSLYQKHYSHDGRVEITFNTQTKAVDYVYYADGDAYSATVVARANNTVTSQYYYFHRDYLGSVVAITNTSGAIVEKRHFDAWGNVVTVTNGSGLILEKLTFTDRGYTGHEHLQGIKIIHMNGRLYDPKVRRLMAPDNFVQDPTNTQSFNRYGYVWNNPLKYTDPSGEIAVTASIVIGAVVAMTTYTMTALLADVPFSAEGFAKSAIFGAISGAASFGIGEAFQTLSSTLNTTTIVTAQAATHGLAQGIISVTQGGDFLSSFASAAVSSLLSSGFGIHGGSIKDSDIGMIAFSTVSGGAVAELTGGNFWQGATTAFLVSALNHAAHKMVEKDKVLGALKKVGIDPYEEINRHWSNGETQQFAEEVFPELSKEANYPRYENVDIIGGNSSINGRAFYSYNEYSKGQFNVKSKGVIQLAKGRFLSNYALASTIGHELIHVVHHVSGQYQAWANKYGTLSAAKALSEIQAYNFNMGSVMGMYNSAIHQEFINQAKSNNWSF